MVSDRQMKRKEKEQIKFKQFLQEILALFRHTNKYNMHYRIQQAEKLVNNIPMAAIIQNAIRETDLSNIHYELEMLQKIIQYEPLTPLEHNNLKKLIKSIYNYFQLKKYPTHNHPSIVSPPSSSTKALKHWNKEPIILFMTEEQKKLWKGSVSIFSVSGDIEYSKLYHTIKLDKCHRCKGKDFTFVNEEMNMIYCIKCGQRYQVINPETKKVWSFK